MKPLFICLVAWEDGTEQASQNHQSAQSALSRASARAQALQAAKSSIVSSIAAALTPLFSAKKGPLRRPE